MTGVTFIYKKTLYETDDNTVMYAIIIAIVMTTAAVAAASKEKKETCYDLITVSVVIRSTGDRCRRGAARTGAALCASEIQRVERWTRV